MITREVEEAPGSGVAGMTAVLARMQSYMKAHEELPPAYEAPPAYTVALAMERDNPPPYLSISREAIIV